MENNTILDAIDEDLKQDMVSRREAIKKGASASSFVMAGLKMGSVPMAIAALATDLRAQAAPSIKQVLDFAFTLENLESEFYKAVLGRSSLAAFNLAFAPVRGTFNAVEVATFDQILKHEIQHVEFLRGVLNTMGGPARNWTAADFDFTGGNGNGMGPFAPATTNKQFLLAATQGFEDTGVRAYKGAAGFLISNDTILEAALRIHSVEGRHASRVRRLRRLSNPDQTTIRYSGTIRGGGAAAAGAGFLNPPQAVVDAFALIYEGDQNTMQAGIDITTLAVGFGGTDAATEAFDEPLTIAQVTRIVDPFIIPAF